MYMGEHIVASIGIGALIYKRFNQYITSTTISMSTIIMLVILTNCIDYDHTLYYHLDDGTINSLSTHPLHMYSSILVLILGGISLVFRQYLPGFFAIILGLSTHLSLDALAFSIGYYPPYILCVAFIQLILLYIILQYSINKHFVKPVLYFAITAQVINIIEVSFFYYIVKADPQTTLYVWIIPPSIALISAVLFKWIFNRYEDKPKTTHE